MDETSETAELLATIWGDAPRPRILGVLYDANGEYVNKSELARRGRFGRTSLYRSSHLEDLVDLGFVEVIREQSQPQYRLTDEAVSGLGEIVDWLQDFTAE